MIYMGKTLLGEKPHTPKAAQYIIQQSQRLQYTCRASLS
jgi:hypothetical protein